MLFRQKCKRPLEVLYEYVKCTMILFHHCKEITWNLLTLISDGVYMKFLDSSRNVIFN
jgi:hypothetical protein